MSKTVKTSRRTIWVSILLTCGALLTAYHFSSGKDQSAQKASSVKGANETAHSTSSKANHPRPATHAKAETNAKAEAAKPSDTASGYANYGESVAGAGITPRRL